jgi:D-amino-acid dehydrogenase
MGHHGVMSQAPRTVVVVGAGIVGLSTAWFLQSEGVEVTVVDRTGVAAGSSRGNAGWLSPALTLPLAEPALLASGVRTMLKSSSPVYLPLAADPSLLRFLAGFVRQCSPRRWEQAMATYAQINRHSLAAFDEVSDGGVAEPVRDARPFLAAFTSTADRDALLHELDHVARVGRPVVHTVLDRDAAHALEPALGDAVTDGIRMEGQRFINPGRFVNALADAVRSRGATMRFGAAVETIDDTGRSARVRLDDGETVSADAVVVATGAWIGRLSRPFGVRRVVQAGRGYSFTVHPESPPANPVYFPAQRVACTPLDPGFRIAGMMEFRHPDAPFDPRRVDAIVRAARPMLRGVDWEARTDEWVGSRPCTSDGLPLIGPTRSARVHVAGGHGMWGVVLGPLTGRLLSRSLVRGEQHDLMRHFDPLR